MNERTLRGRCFCGNVSFEVADPVKFACFCHCESCRRAAGGAYVPWGTFASDQFTLTAGTFTEHHSSPKVTRGHCSICGTSLTYEHEARAGQIDITLTSFDDPSQFTPEAHIWVEDRLPWVHIDDGLPQFEKTVSTH